MTANTPRVDVERFDLHGVSYVRSTDHDARIAALLLQVADLQDALVMAQNAAESRRERYQAAESKLAECDAEIERVRVQLAECFRVAGGDADCCQSSQVARAVEVVTDLRQCYDERGQELIAAERAREEACGLLRDVRRYLYAETAVAMRIDDFLATIGGIASNE